MSRKDRRPGYLSKLILARNRCPQRRRREREGKQTRARNSAGGEGVERTLATAPDEDPGYQISYRSNFARCSWESRRPCSPQFPRTIASSCCWPIDFDYVTDTHTNTYVSGRIYKRAPRVATVVLSIIEVSKFLNRVPVDTRRARLPRIAVTARCLVTFYGIRPPVRTASMSIHGVAKTTAGR